MLLELGHTWDDITENVYTASALPPCNENDFTELRWVAVAPDDPDWVAVVGRAQITENLERPFWVVASDDGGDNFTFAGEPRDPSTSTYLDVVRDIAVSPEVDGIHNIAVAGRDDCGGGAILVNNKGLGFDDAPDPEPTSAELDQMGGCSVAGIHSYSMVRSTWVTTSPATWAEKRPTMISG